VGAWVRGCVGAWVRGCVGAWVRGCEGVWVCRYVGVWVCGYVSVWVRGHRHVSAARACALICGCGCVHVWGTCAFARARAWVGWSCRPAHGRCVLCPPANTENSVRMISSSVLLPDAILPSSAMRTGPPAVVASDRHKLGGGRNARPLAVRPPDAAASSAGPRELLRSNARRTTMPRGLLQKREISALREVG
jgi:hypothetical protein